MDVYFSPLDKTFVVSTNKTSGLHNVSIDPKFKVQYTDDWSTATSRREKRDSAADLKASRGPGDVFRMEQHNADKLDTFVTIMHMYTFLKISNVRHRVVITLPHHIHKLKTSRFFIVLMGRGDNTHQNQTTGNLFFRQDQPHIDLFVFFSVFFSCFFLFLAFCVLLWKVKEAFNIRRSRRRRRVEMENMASRPFGKALVMIDSDMPVVLNSPILRKNRLPKLSSKYSFMMGHSGGGDRDGRTDVLQLEDRFNIQPLAIEPTDDGIAAIGTVMFQLPGGATAPSRVALGSSLITMRVMYPSHNYVMKNVCRRRTSSSMA